jgi:hypothetical protein
MVTDDWLSSAALTDKQRAALAFTDDVLSNTAGAQRWLTDELGFDDVARQEVTVGLGLFHGFSKALIALGCEPPPGSMDTTELPTPDAKTPCGSLADGMASLHHAVDAEVEVALMESGRNRLRALLGLAVDSGVPDRQLTGRQSASDIAELFVIDIHSVTHANVAALVGDIGEAATVAYFIGLAAADAQARTERAAI